MYSYHIVLRIYLAVSFLPLPPVSASYKKELISENCRAVAQRATRKTHLSSHRRGKYCFSAVFQRCLSHKMIEYLCFEYAYISGVFFLVHVYFHATPLPYVLVLLSSQVLLRRRMLILVGTNSRKNYYPTFCIKTVFFLESGSKFANMTCIDLEIASSIVTRVICATTHFKLGYATLEIDCKLNASLNTYGRRQNFGLRFRMRNQLIFYRLGCY